jgi:diguanylate cyclase (GGDEF)-like protein/PAS domain S-box-containing protein
MAHSPILCHNCNASISAETLYCHNCGMPTRTRPAPDQSHDLEKFFDLALDLFCIAGTDGFFKRVNPAFERVLGYTAEELTGQPFVDFIHPDDRTETLREVGKLTEGSPTLAFENRYRCKDGSYKNLYWTSFPDPNSGLLYAVGRDVTEIRRLQDKLWQPLRVDLLTGVANRQAFHEHLDEEWRRGSRGKIPLTMAIVDLDSFGDYNDLHGRPAGDACLQVIADLLRSYARRTGDVVARFGGNRFSLLLTGGLTAEAGRDAADRIRTEIADLTIDHPHSDVPGRITVSIGVASVLPRPNRSPSSLIAAAEDSLAAAKHEGRNRVSGADPGLRNDS